MEEIKLLTGAAPFFYPGSDTGCLVLHGLTGTPFEVRWLGQHLNQQGHTVYGPRLAGHGTTPRDLAFVTWREWYADVLAAYELLRAQCRRVFVLGLSMGGALTLLLASQEPVDGIVTMSAPYEIRDWRRPLLPLVGRVVKTISKGYRPEDEERFHQHVLAEQTRRGEQPTGHPSYKEWVVPAAAQFLHLLDHARPLLPRVTAPALLIHSHADRTVPFENMQRIYDAIGSSDKQMLALDHSDHCVAEDVESARVFEAATSFIAAHR